MIFQNRRDAGRQLATRLRSYARRDDVVVLALPRGGVPVAYEVARALQAPLDVFIVRKLGVPGNEEYAMGAIASGGVRVLNQDVIAALRIGDAALTETEAREQRELERREAAYRKGGHPVQAIAGRTAILVDDGLATGASMRAAIHALRQLQPARIVVAVPVGAPETCEQMREEADDVVCAVEPRAFGGVGLWYTDFTQTDDAHVHRLLAASRATEPPLRRASS